MRFNLVYMYAVISVKEVSMSEARIARKKKPSEKTGGRNLERKQTQMEILYWVTLGNVSIHPLSILLITSRQQDAGANPN